MSDELLSCPFCGGGDIAVFSHADYGYGPTFHVECRDDNCGNGTCHHGVRDEAIAAWNQRTPAPGDVESEHVARKAAADLLREWARIHETWWGQEIAENIADALERDDFPPQK